jgi:hypothetical protein
MTDRQRGSGYPSDLILFWEGHHFICTLISQISLSKNRGSPTLQLDSLYAELLALSPDLLFILSGYRFFPDLSALMRLCHLTSAVFRPFLAFRSRLLIPFPEGDSPADFLENPDRAGALYLEPDVVSGKLLLSWIRGIKEFISGGDFKPTP